MGPALGLRGRQGRRPRPTRWGSCSGSVQTWAPGHLGGGRGPRPPENGQKHQGEERREGSGRRRHGAGLRADWEPEEGAPCEGKHEPRPWMWSKGVACSCAESCPTVGRTQAPFFPRPGFPALLGQPLCNSDPTCRRHRKSCVITAAMDSRIGLLLSLCNLYPKADICFHVKGPGPGGKSPHSIQVTFRERSLSLQRWKNHSRNGPVPCLLL